MRETKKAPRNGRGRYDYYEDEDEFDARPRRRKKSHAGAAVLAVLLVLVIGAGAFVWLRYGDRLGLRPAPSANAAQDAQAAASDSIEARTYDEALEALLQDDPSLPAISASQQVNVTDLKVHEGLSDEWLNILLLGGDSRDLVTPSRTDTMMICSVNTKTGEIRLTSIMRDLAVDLSDIGENSGIRRINSAYYFGGPKLAMRTVNQLLDMNITNYVFVNFFGFQQIAHAMGGIDIDITENEKDQINYWVKHQYWLGNKYGVDESNLTEENVLLDTFGENIHLNGRQTLAYCRIRKIDSDFARSERQRNVLYKLMEKARGYSAYELTGLAVLASQYVSTNMNVNDIVALAMTVVKSDTASTKTLRLPLNGTYSQETRRDESMLYDCNWYQNAQALHRFIYEG